jgi:glycosyltransferase involved in cell wall biosynthesis
MAKNTYIDVTQLVHWDNKLTGIPRVMHELAIRFHDNASDVLFVSWVKEVQAYCLIDYDRSVLNRGNGILYAKQSDELKSSIKNESTKSFKRSQLKTFAKKGAGRLLKFNPSFYDRAQQALSNRKAQTYVKVKLGSDDAVFIGWGEWWDDNFLLMLETAHGEGAKISTVIHDVGPMVTPHLSGHSSESLANYCKRIVPICDVVMVNSHFTKKTLKNWLKENKLNIPDIEIFILGDDFNHTEPKAPRDPRFASSGLKGGDYVMTVGTIELKKNHLLLYYVYYLAHEKGIDLPKLVVVGRKGWASDAVIAMMESDPVLKDKFILLFDTADDELAWLYQHAKYSVFPSFYEGWGIPVAESLFNGVPVISSHASSLAEVGGDLVARFSPGSTDDCLKLMQRMSDEENYQEQKKRVSSYEPATWDNTYIQTAAALRKKGMIND